VSAKRGKLPASEAKSVRFSDRNSKCGNYALLSEYVSSEKGSELKPRLVKSMKYSADGMTWNMELHSNVKFHDGSTMTPEDVVYSFQRMLAVKTAITGTIAGFLKADGVQANGPNFVQFKLTEPYAPFLAVLPLLPIVNRKLLLAKTVDNDWAKAFLLSNSAGSGPYKVVPGSFAPVDKFDLEWFPDYFRGWPKGHEPMKIVLDRYIKDNTTALLAIQKGDIDATNGYVPPDQFATLEKAPGVRLSKEPALRTFMARMNHQRAPFNNVNFRKAISHAFPYQVFIEKVMLGFVDRIKGPIPKGVFGAPSDLTGYEHDLSKAKEYLQLAAKDGVDIKQEIEFVALTGYDETVSVAQLLQSELRKIGVTMRISKGQWANMVTACLRPETTPQIWSHWSTPYYVDPDNWTGPYYTKMGLGTTRGSSWYTNEKVQAMLVEASRIPDTSKRLPLYEEASRMLVADAADLWIYQGKVARAIRTRVKGYSPSATGDAVDLRQMWVES
jgi:peptide/nickel transport system substrate-binding protein